MIQEKSSVSYKTEIDSPRIIKQDLFDQMLEEYIELKKEDQLIRPRLRHKEQQIKQKCRNMLKSSSSNENLMPQLRNDSSMQLEDLNLKHFQTENSHEDSFRRSFKKRAQQSFSIQNTERHIDSQEQFSQTSDSAGQKYFTGFQYKFQEQERQMKNQQNEKKNEAVSISCNCKRSKCLKLYCQCFHKQVFCNQKCKCYNCGNKNNTVQHQQAIIEALSRNPQAFEEQFQQIQNPEGKTGNAFSLGVQPDQVRRGCKCKKTKCLKKYCECYCSGQVCGIFCKCQGCENHAVYEFSQIPATQSNLIKISKTIK